MKSAVFTSARFVALSLVVLVLISRVHAQPTQAASDSNRTIQARFLGQWSLTLPTKEAGWLERSRWNLV